MVAESSGFQPMNAGELTGRKEFSERLAREAAESTRQASAAPAPKAVAADGAR